MGVCPVIFTDPSTAHDWPTSSNLHRSASLDDIDDREEDHPERNEDYYHHAKRCSLTNSSSGSHVAVPSMKHQQRSRSLEFDSYFSDQDGRILRADSRSASIDVSSSFRMSHHPSIMGRVYTHRLSLVPS